VVQLFQLLIERWDVLPARQLRGGENPLDMFFKGGTLEPLAVVQDDSVTYCAASMRGR